MILDVILLAAVLGGGTVVAVPGAAKLLNQAGVKTDYIKLEDVGLPGNGYEMMIEKKSDEIVAYFECWLEKIIP